MAESITTIASRYGVPAPDVCAQARPHPSAATLSAWLREADRLTRTLLEPVSGSRLDVPCLRIVNPPLWELGHIAWFQEFWLHRRGRFEVPSLLPDADQRYDSSRVEHDSRWHLDLPDLGSTWRYAGQVLDRSLEMLDRPEAGDETLYFATLAVLHQDMHNEAFVYMWQTLGYPLAGAPAGAGAARPAGRRSGDATIPAGRFRLGAERGAGFVFDNEKWAHEIELPAFSIARETVSCGEFLAFVEDDGYHRREFWCGDGWQAIRRLDLSAPRCWSRGDGWQVRRFDRQIPLPLEEPVVHVSAWEAEAYCRWAGRRLPTEAEWERAASTGPDSSGARRYPWGDMPLAGVANLGRPAGHTDPTWARPEGDSAWGVRQMLGNVWEWTASRFAPYPGFEIDPYREYSAPWFPAPHRVLRGGSFATPLRLIRNTWRNFYKPDRADVFCGFRTCAT